MRLAVGGVVSFIVTGGLSAILGTVLIFAAVSAISSLLGGSTAGVTSAAPTSQPASPSDITAALRSVLAFMGYTFFAGHFTPIEASGLGGATYSLVGVGSVTIAAVAMLVPFFFTRALEKAFPSPTLAGAVGRGLVIAAPYGILCLGLYFPSFVSIGSDQFGISLHPSGLGLVLPAVLVGVGGAMGAASVRAVLNPAASSATRGAARATLAIFVGVLATALIVAIWLTVEALTNQSANASSAVSGAPLLPPTTTTGNAAQLTPAARNLGWSLLTLVPFYLGNVLSLIWSATLGGDLFSNSSWHPILYLGPIIGAVIGALQLRKQPDRIEQASFALCFSVATGAIAFLTTPAIVNGPALLHSAWTAVLVALVIGAVAAFVGPYLLVARPIAVISDRPPMTWVVKPLLGLWPGDALRPQDFVQSPSRPPTALPRLTRPHAVGALVVVALTLGAIIGNAQLSARYSPEATAIAYLQAISRGDADTVWSMVSYEGGSATSSPLLSKAALRRMLSYSANTSLSAIRVSDSARDDDSHYTVGLSLTKDGQPTTMRLHLRRDASRSNLVIYPSWRVVIAPTNIQITSFKHAGTIYVDDFQVGLSDGGGLIAVIPGQHNVALAPTDIFEGNSQVVDASNDASATFTATLTAQATTAVAKSIGDLFARCAASQQLSPPNCPNSTYGLGDHRSGVHWSLVGDPTSGMQLTIGNAEDTIAASGQWKMHVAYNYWYDFDASYVQNWDEDVSGYFDDTLHWNGGGFDITNQSGY